MPGVSRKVSAAGVSRVAWVPRTRGPVGRRDSRCHTRAALALAVACAVLAGCAAPQRAERERFTLLVMAGQADPTLEIVIYGGLLDRSPPPQARRPLQTFLYGPEDAPRRSLLRHPAGIAVAGDSIFVADQGFPDMLRVDLPSRRAWKWSERECRPACPVGVCTDAQGRLFVADATLRTVFVSDAEGRCAGQIVLPPRNEGSGAAGRPVAVLVDGGTLLVADGEGVGPASRAVGLIRRYALAEQRWLPPYPVTACDPPMVAPTGLAMTADGVLLVADAISGVVHRIGRDGTPLSPIGVRGRRLGEFVRPMHVCVTPGGRIVVSDAAKQSVIVFDKNGRFAAEIGGGMNGFRGFTLPMGVAALGASETLALALGIEGQSGEEFVIVSDALGPDSLTVLGIRSKGNGEQR